MEESGCLSELGYLVDSYDQNYFDVLHLTGHATLQAGQPRFVTETLTGEAYYASAADIAQELQFRLPKLIFLSGCRTGQAGNGGDVPSMAEELLQAGAKAVLGWGQKVLDPEATAAAAALYQELAAGKQIVEAVASTYQALIKNQARDWHLLRLYAAGDLPGALVTPLRTRGRKPAPAPSVTTQFLDPAGKVKVPTRESFVGRRRQLQNCLRVLTQSSNEIGVLIHGMGGLGKSSLAARLCDRLPTFERVVWVERIDEGNLVSRLAENLDDNEQRKSLQNYEEELKFRLRRVLQQLHEVGKSFLLVLDDFEVNLAPRNEGYVLQAEAAEVLKALVWAIRENYTSHRIIITCRYDFEFSLLQYFYKQPLDALQGADLRKKFNRLTAFGDKSQVDEALKLQAQRLADGNPRLLEWLDKILQNKTVDQAAILQRLAADPVELREQVLAEALLQQMDETMREMLSRGLVFELPVPREALAAVCENIPSLEDYINRAVALGLLEVSHDEALRVPRILPVLAGDGEVLYKQGAEVLYRLWWEQAETSTEERALEIHQLAYKGKAEKIAVDVTTALARTWINLSRFRQAVNICQVTLKITDNYHIFHQLARSEKELGDIESALKDYEKARSLCPVEDEKTKAAIIHNLAGIHVLQGQFSKAMSFYQQSLEIAIRIGDYKGQAAILHDIASMYASQGQSDKAITYLQQVNEIDERLDNLPGKATTLNTIATIYVNQGKLQDAITYLQESFGIYKNIGNVQGQVVTSLNIANIYDMQGKYKDAIIILDELLIIEENNGYIYEQAVTLNSIAFIYSKQGQFDKSIAYFERSFEITKSLKNVNGQATTLTNRAFINARQGKVKEAILLYEQLLELQESIDDIPGKAATLRMLGQLLAKQGNFDMALYNLQQSLEILQRIQSPHAEEVRQMVERIQGLIGNS
ncbi:TPR repeat-containing protein [Tolypothrix tenuis PCC 7101]|uniref:TPR repeat-containing protein n=2 Tax=Tolypothrix TaxID=111782 RepID=A0A1Z4MUD9_9CYAN|nr:TPR repeat-containing protein [Tolypothrix tenuis PCC 7101]BAZ72449.1 TPR repeat-containing protein [Aulosira laxa NIES-50]